MLVSALKVIASDDEERMYLSLNLERYLKKLLNVQPIDFIAEDHASCSFGDYYADGM